MTEFEEYDQLSGCACRDETLFCIFMCGPIVMLEASTGVILTAVEVPAPPRSLLSSSPPLHGVSVVRLRQALSALQMHPGHMSGLARLWEADRLQDQLILVRIMSACPRCVALSTEGSWLAVLTASGPPPLRGCRSQRLETIEMAYPSLYSFLLALALPFFSPPLPVIVPAACFSFSSAVRNGRPVLPTPSA